MSVNVSTELSDLDLDNFGGVEDVSLNSEAKISKVAITALETWGYGFLFVTVINLSSVMGIIFFPLMKTSIYKNVMRAMIGLAIGTLSGSALFHLIPKAFGLEDRKEDFLDVAAFVWLAIWIAMLLEGAIKIGVKARTQSKLRKKQALCLNGDLMRENNNPMQKLADQDVEVSVTVPNGHAIAADSLKEFDEEDDDAFDGLPKKDNLALPVYHSTFSLSNINVAKMNESEGGNEIKTVAWIVIIGDSLHNFIDGVSIGAGFAQDFHTGVILSLAVIFEEFPHELGDFAILISSGLTVKKALFFNFLSALTCYLGLFLGIMLGKIDWENYIFAFAAGIFIYVSIGDMIPEVTGLIDKVSDTSPRRAFKVLLIHNLGILIGVTILFVLAHVQPA